MAHTNAETIYHRIGRNSHPGGESPQRAQAPRGLAVATQHQTDNAHHDHHDADETPAADVFVGEEEPGHRYQQRSDAPGDGVALRKVGPAIGAH